MHSHSALVNAPFSSLRIGVYLVTLATLVATLACFFLSKSCSACALRAFDDIKEVESVFVGRNKLIIFLENDF